MLEIADECDLQANLYNGHNTVDNVKLVREVHDVGVEGPRDDGEDHVQEGKHGCEPEEFHVLNKKLIKSSGQTNAVRSF